MSRVGEKLAPDAPDLFSIAGPGARRTDPETSHQAADRYPKLRGSDRREALFAHAINWRSGLTDFELGDLIGRQQTSAGKRRGELRDMGLIASSEDRRPAPSGSPTIVWKITEEGKKAALELKPELAL